jgi:hypothetical protein
VSIMRQGIARRLSVLLVSISIVGLVSTSAPIASAQVPTNTPGPPTNTPGPTITPPPNTPGPTITPPPNTPGPTITPPPNTPGPTAAPNPPPESTTETVAAGGTATTDDEADGATPNDPVETQVTVPEGGTVTVEETSVSEAEPAGYDFFGQQVNIDAPPGTQTEPLEIVFRIDASLLSPGAPIDMFRDGVLIGDCADVLPFTNDEDVCVQSRVELEDGDVEVTILTVHASPWNFGKAAEQPTPRRCHGFGRVLCFVVKVIWTIVRVLH